MFFLPCTVCLLGSAIPCRRILGKEQNAVLLVCGFTVAADEAPDFTALAHRSIELLTAQPGCRRAVLGHSADDPDRWVMTVEFTSVVAYRRAMSPFEVREHVIPLLSRGEASAYEVLAEATDGHVEQHTSVVAADAATVRPGDASGPATPRS
jgi:quinol monooxygenase YgiN